MGPKGAAIAIIIVLILAVAFVAATYSPLYDFICNLLGIQNSVYITGVSLEIGGAHPTSCFGSVIQPLPGFNVQRGSQFNYTLNLTNSCPDPHNITNVSVLNGGFSVRSVSPRLQYEVFGNNRVQLSMVVVPAQGFGGGVLTLQLNVT